MEPKYSKQILKLSRPDLKLLIEIITGHNNLRTFSTKIQTLTNTHCRFCNLAPETVIHMITECTNFKTERQKLKLNKFNPQLSRTRRSRKKKKDVLPFSLPTTTTQEWQVYKGYSFLQLSPVGTFFYNFLATNTYYITLCSVQLTLAFRDFFAIHFV